MCVAPVDRLAGVPHHSGGKTTRGANFFGPVSGPEAGATGFWSGACFPHPCSHSSFPRSQTPVWERTSAKLRFVLPRSLGRQARNRVSPKGVPKQEFGNEEGRTGVWERGSVRGLGRRCPPYGRTNQ